jgi:uncharacterized membrane protein (DUF485 family)
MIEGLTDNRIIGGVKSLSSLKRTRCSICLKVYIKLIVLIMFNPCLFIIPSYGHTEVDLCLNNGKTFHSG